MQTSLFLVWYLKYFTRLQIRTIFFFLLSLFFICVKCELARLAPLSLTHSNSTTIELTTYDAAMASYISHYLPSFKTPLNFEGTSQDVETLNSGEPGHVQYIAIIETNNDAQGTKEELDSKLNKRLITFAHSDTKVEISSNVKIRLAGLLQGVYAFSLEFVTSHNGAKNIRKPMVISSKGESFVVVQIEESFTLVCSIASDDKIVIKQLQYILKQQHRFFVLFHKSLGTIKKETGVDLLRNLLTQWWSNFVFKYNEKLSTSEIKWPNSLNYTGFNSFILVGYKKSSTSLPNKVKDEFRKLILEEELLPHGLVISSLTPTIAKKMGLIHAQPMTDKLEPQSLVDLHNWMEFDCAMHASDKERTCPGESEIRTGEDATSFLNPVTLTNNLVVLPWNKMSDLIRGGSATDTTSVYEDSLQHDPNTSESWLSRTVFGNSRESNVSAGHSRELIDAQESVNLREHQFDHFLYGIQRDHSISRKLVYLPTKDSCLSTREEEPSNELEYQLVTYCHDDIFITLIYDSLETSHLDDAGFYRHLTCTIFEPLHEEITQFQTSTLGTSTNSVTTLNLTNIDSNFLYSVSDFKRMNYASSIPLILDQTHEKFPTIVNIHDQLIKICENFDFTAHEFYHKFTLGSKHDWMSYIIKYDNKLIIVIKNNNKTTSGGGGGGVVVPPEERNMVNQITGLVSDYASLGFLENLGDDVKYWLGQVINTE